MIKLQDVVKVRDTMTVGPIDTTITKGTLTLIAGKNSKGKSTLLKLIASIIEADEGSILIDSLPANDYVQDVGVNYMPDTFPYPVKGEMLYDYMIWMREVFQNFDANLLKEYAKTMSIPLNNSIVKMSKGELKRALIALTFANKDKLILLDEPSLNLDSNYKKKLIDILQEKLLNDENKVIVASNNVEDFEVIADYVIYLQEGKVTIQGYIEDILNQYKLWKGTEKELPEDVVNWWKQDFTVEAIIDSKRYPKLESERISLAELLHNIERTTEYESIF